MIIYRFPKKENHKSGNIGKMIIMKSIQKAETGNVALQETHGWSQMTAWVPSLWHPRGRWPSTW